MVTDYLQEVNTKLVSDHLFRCINLIALLERVHSLLDTATSEAFLAEIPLRSPQNKFIFIIKNYTFRIKVSKKTCNLILKKTALTAVFPALTAG